MAITILSSGHSWEPRKTVGGRHGCSHWAETKTVDRWKWTVWEALSKTPWYRDDLKRFDKQDFRQRVLATVLIRVAWNAWILHKSWVVEERTRNAVCFRARFVFVLEVHWIASKQPWHYSSHVRTWCHAARGTEDCSLSAPAFVARIAGQRLRNWQDYASSLAMPTLEAICLAEWNDEGETALLATTVTRLLNKEFTLLVGLLDAGSSLMRMTLRLHP